MSQEQQDDQQQQSGGAPVPRRLLWAAGILVALAFLILVVCGYLFGWKWTGLPKRTAWDWLDLLIVPIVLAVGGYLFTRTENQRTLQSSQEQREVDREIAKDQVETDRTLAQERRQDDTLQAYLDGMPQLLTDKELPLHSAQPGDSLSTVARARTLTVLGRLDSERKRSVVQFLFESKLIYKEQTLLDEGELIERRHRVVSLQQAELRGAHLSGTDLREADLQGADLQEAKLQEAHLDEAKLQGSDLRGANLKDASLQEAKLEVADLKEAKLLGAYLQGADLQGADLQGADLQEAWEITQDQIDSTTGSSETTLPDGLKRPELWSKSMLEQRKILQELILIDSDSMGFGRIAVNKVGILPRFIENSSPPASMDGRSNPTRVARETYKTKNPRSVRESRERKGRNL